MGIEIPITKVEVLAGTFVFSINNNPENLGLASKRGGVWYAFCPHGAFVGKTFEQAVCNALNALVEMAGQKVH